MKVIDGTNLLDNIIGNGKQEATDFSGAKVSSITPAPFMKKMETFIKSDEEADSSGLTYKKPEKEASGGTVDDIMQQAGRMDATQMKNKMVVAANSTTLHDCKELKDEGFSLENTKIETVVTMTDKIKMTLAKAGVDVSYYGDGLSADQLEQMTGSAAMAQQICAKMQQSDVPATEQNVEESKEALQQASELQPLGAGAIKYMLDNELVPTISNLYKAQYSGSGYYEDHGQEALPEGLIQQIQQVVQQSDRQDTEEAEKDGEWMLQNHVLLTAENLSRMGELKQMELPPSPEKVIDAIVDALTEGKRPVDARLDSDALKEKAKQIEKTLSEATDEDIALVIAKEKPVTIKNLAEAHQMLLSGDVPKSEKDQAAELSEATKNVDLQQDITENTKTAADAALYAGNVTNGTGNTVEGTLPVQQTSGYELVNGVQYTEIQITMIISRRQLEEVRLSMTMEASLTMLRMGISVDTEPMEVLINQLKNTENQYFQNLLAQGGVEATTDSVSMFSEVTVKLDELKEMPAYALGVPKADLSTLNQLHAAGGEMQQNFQQANQRYETMQTQVRKDLGDSIQNAFRNVDDILNDLDLDTSIANQRAVRILAYNYTEITTENIMQMKAADLEVQRAFHNLTPAVVREFIGRGINPLDMDISELNRTAESIKEELGIESQEEKFSEYLYKMEQNHEISKEQRSSYIGIYRLIHQVVQSDGAAIGALVNQGADLTMRNLLMAVRTAKHGKIDVSIDGTSGEKTGNGYSNSITEQINAAYQGQCMVQALDEITPERMRVVAQTADWEQMTPEQFMEHLQEAQDDVSAEESYYEQQLGDLAQSAQASEEVYQALEEYDIPNTVANVVAMSELLKDRNQAYKRLFGMGTGREVDANRTIQTYMKQTEDGAKEVDFNAIREELLRRFSEDVKRPEGLAEAMTELAECAEHCMQTMILEKDVSSLDVRELRLMNRQISIGAKMASDECFSLPIMIDGEMTNVTLKVVRDKEKRGLVNVTMQTAQFGKIAAELKAKKNGISGYIAAESDKAKDTLVRMQDDLKHALKIEDGQDVDLHFTTNGQLDLYKFAAGSGKSEETNVPEDREVQTKVLYGMAEAFITVIKRMGR